MLLPPVELDIDPQNPDDARTLISRLARCGKLGIVESFLPDSENAVLLVHGERYRYTVFVTKGKATQIYESVGPKVVRVWMQDSPEERAQANGGLTHYFGEREAGLDRFVYLYTEASWFIWREHISFHLPRIKRRAFQISGHQAAVLHVRQSDVSQGERLEYFLELEGRIWKCSMTIRLDDSGQPQITQYEDAHAVTSVGF